MKQWLTLLQERLALREQIAPWRDRFAALQPRERQLVSIAAVVSGVLLLWAGIWQPIHHWRDERAQDLAAARDSAIQLEHLAAVKAQIPQADSGRSATQGASLLSAVDIATHQGGLSAPPSRIQPEGDSRVRIWFTGIPFEVLVHWIDSLHSHFGIEVDTAEVERKDTPGIVDARLVLVRR